MITHLLMHQIKEYSLFNWLPWSDLIATNNTVWRLLNWQCWSKQTYTHQSSDTLNGKKLYWFSRQGLDQLAATHQQKSTRFVRSLWVAVTRRTHKTETTYLRTIGVCSHLAGLDASLWKVIILLVLVPVSFHANARFVLRHICTSHRFGEWQSVCKVFGGLLTLDLFVDTSTMWSSCFHANIYS